ncbi:MAG: S8/S53 family peptidase [Thermoplasmatota archaeon]
MHRTVILALLLVGAAGCIDDVDEPATTPPVGGEPVMQAPSQVVVAVIDSNANPYHEFFQQHNPIDDAILDSFVDHNGKTVERVRLTQEGTYEERREADADFWATVEPGQLYHFEGTRLLGISFGGNIVDGGTHGIGTTAAVLEANPDAIVILVQGTGSSAGEQWAAQAPFVDILSESYGLYCGQPALELLPGDSTAKNNKIAWDNGKIPVGAADNTPCPAMNDGTSGPPWVVGVSGDHPAAEGSCREPVSGNFPDFTADFTQDLPYVNDVEGTRTVSGTSFSTPTTAGSFSRALLQVREAWNHTGGITDGALALGPDGARLGQYDLWHAFNQTAVYFSTAVCDESGSVPVNPAAPWVQMGWGHVDSEIGDHAARVLLGEAPPIKDAAAVAYMESVYTYRQTVWPPVI